MTKIPLSQWKNNWPELTKPPDQHDRDRERIFLRDHARYGATIHRHTADALAEAARATREFDRRHTLFLRLFAEYVNALEALGAWGWALPRRRQFRLFLDGFLAYPPSAPDTFYRRALAHDGDLITLLDLPERSVVVTAIQGHVSDGGRANEVAEYLSGGLASVRQAGEQYFAENSVLLTHYNKAKHGATMLRLDDHTDGEFDFQVIAPQLHSDAIEAGVWYDIAKFSATDEMIERIRRNCQFVSTAVQQLAIITWVLHDDGLLYD